MFAPRAKRSSQNRGPDRERVQFTTFSLQFTTFSPVGACTQNVLAASLPLPLPLTPSEYRPVRRAALRNGSRSRSQCPCAAPTWWLEDRAITAGGLASRSICRFLGRGEGCSPTWAAGRPHGHPQRCTHSAAPPPPRALQRIRAQPGSSPKHIASWSTAPRRYRTLRRSKRATTAAAAAPPPQPRATAEDCRTETG